MQLPKNAASANALVGIWRLSIAAVLILALHAARDVLIPMAVAMLLAFVMTPVVKRLERWIGRIAAALIVVLLVCFVAGGTGWVLTRQLVNVGAKIPDYQENILQKARTFQLPGGVVFSRLTQMFGELKKELPGTPKPEAARGTPQAVPMPVEIVQKTQPGAAELAQKIAIYLLGPIGQTALVSF